MRHFLFALILFLSCTTRPEDIPGCTDSTACNFNSEANVDDGSCADLDCQGNCDGDAFKDSCGYCDADPLNDCSVGCVDIMAEFSIGEEEFQCENGITEEGYDCNDLTTILNIMYNNPHSLHGGMDADSNKIITVYEYGVQHWSSDRLTSLNLNYNENVVMPTYCSFRLTTLPVNIGELSALTKLSLINNALTSLPESITNLISLEQLLVESNQIESLPDNFGSMSSLKILRLNDNKLNSLPQSIGNMDSLEELWLQENELVTLPDEIGDCGSLVTLKIDDNLLQSLPESIENLGSLKELTLDNNNLIDLPQNLCMETDGEKFYEGLETFSISNNNLCPGSFPACIPNTDVENQVCLNCPPSYFLIEGYCAYESDYNILQNFLDLNPESQSLPAHTGIPDDASECVNEDWWNGGRLVEISFLHKQLTSIIPENLGDLEALQILRLTGNELTGEIPDKITNLNNLKILKLNSNNLNGNIPGNIGALSEIDTLSLNNNDLSGEIPQSITNLSKLKFLRLEYNDLSGSIPYNIGDLNNLRYLYLRDNKLFGEIPTSISSLISLKRLKLINNYLSGQIPESICNIYDINENLRLYLDNNQLCPGPSGYPECIPEFHIGFQECSD